MTTFIKASNGGAPLGTTFPYNKSKRYNFAIVSAKGILQCIAKFILCDFFNDFTAFHVFKQSQLHFTCAIIIWGTIIFISKDYQL